MNRETFTIPCLSLTSLLPASPLGPWSDGPWSGGRFSRIPWARHAGIWEIERREAGDYTESRIGVVAGRVVYERKRFVGRTNDVVVFSILKNVS